MRSAAALALLSLALIALAACSQAMDVTLFDNTGVPISINSGSQSVLAPGRSKDFHYPEGSVNWALLITAGSCDYLYQMPRSLEHWPWPLDYKTNPTVQVERDFSIWAVPPGAAGVADVSGLAAQQVDGFPLHPVSKTCH